MPRRRLSKQQRAFLGFLRERERKRESFTAAEVAAATGWKPSTFRTYVAKKRLGDRLVRRPDGSYEARGFADMNEDTFHRLLTQSGPAMRLEYGFRDPLAGALVKRARDNMILALETYNRPSLDNRLDAFTMLFCTAWEQLMKAEILEAGEKSIFRKPKPNRRRETIGFQECLRILFRDGDPVRKNLEAIRKLRDAATHLLMREVQPVASGLFQAGVLNFARRYERVTGEPLVPDLATGLLSLVIPPKPVEPTVLEQRYGRETARDIASLIDEIRHEADQEPDDRYAVPIQHHLVLSRDRGETSIFIRKAEQPGPGVKDAVLVEKPVNAESRYPLKEGELIAALNQRLDSDLNQRDIRAMLFALKLRNGNNKYHHEWRLQAHHSYSWDCVDLLADKLSGEPRFRETARRKYQQWLSKRKRKSTG